MRRKPRLREEAGALDPCVLGKRLVHTGLREEAGAWTSVCTGGGLEKKKPAPLDLIEETGVSFDRPSAGKWSYRRQAFLPSGLVVGRGDTGEHMQTSCGHMSGRARRMERERRRGTETGSRGQEILRESRKRQGWAGRPWAPRLSV